MDSRADLLRWMITRLDPAVRDMKQRLQWMEDDLNHLRRELKMDKTSGDVYLPSADQHPFGEPL